MKTFLNIGALGLLIMAATAIQGFAQPPSPPPVPGNHGQNGAPPVGAPIDGGLGILLALGATYGGRKVYVAWKKRGTKDERRRTKDEG